MPIADLQDVHRKCADWFREDPSYLCSDDCPGRPLPLDTPIARLPFRTRTKNVLESAGLLTLGDLTQATKFSLYRKPNIGRIVVNEVRDFLQDIGLDLADPPVIPSPSEVDALLARLERLDEEQFAEVLQRATEALGRRLAGRDPATN